MAEYIKRDDALNFEMEIEADPSEIQAITKGMALYSEYIKDIPAVDVAPIKHAKWEQTYKLLNYECSNCNNEIELGKRFFMQILCGTIFYCPYCGARMDGDK